ncbi:MAG: energy-coupled thiamine transporter ThiT [Coriobacteriia bacterium]|nr:energy-coupled thiamine transporter ThiT [Coriobacteriia bacterium]
MNVSRTRLGVEIALAVALAAVLSFIAPWQMPQGGSVSFHMLPIFVLALMRGPGVGISTGALYGVLDFLLKPYFFHPVQVALDYPIAFAACGLAGVFAGRWAALHAEGRTGAAFWQAAVPGMALGAVGRYVAHVLSGLVFFSSYAVDAGQAPIVYSMVYNSFVLVSAIACIVAAFAVLPPLQRLYGGRST